MAIMLLAPPVLLYALAQAGAFTHSAVGSYGAVTGAWAVGMAALALSGWPRDLQLIAGLAYTLAAIPVLPLLGLLAVCTTGDCL